MSDLLIFPGREPASSEKLGSGDSGFGCRSSAGLRDAVIGHPLVGLRQTPWMAPVCIQDAGGMKYECRMTLELEAGHRVELKRRELAPVLSSDGWEQIRTAEHRWDPACSPLGRTIIAVAVNDGQIVHVIVDDGTLLSIDERSGGPLRAEWIDPSTELARSRLASLSDLWTGVPLVQSDS